MKTQELSNTQQETQQIELIKGEFTNTEASRVILNLIDEKINFNKIRNLQIWESNHQTDTTEIKNRIKELEQQKELAEKFFKSLEGSESRLKLESTINITML